MSTSLEEFTEGQPFDVVWAPTTAQEQEFMIARARHGIAKVRFDLLESNCEDFVNWVRTGVAYSETRSLIFVSLITLLAFGFALSMARTKA
ncbi:MAG: lecithin retinol acyltransferase family protein [Acidobacteria bacterium]|nr:lecithin retinol acyltransferase family protein [Acidobacteriota bacterium]